MKKTDNQKRYKDFYKVGTVSTELGTYNLYLEMNQDWVDEYQKDPTNVDYRLLISGDKLTPREAYRKHIITKKISLQCAEIFLFVSLYILV